MPSSERSSELLSLNEPSTLTDFRSHVAGYLISGVIGVLVWSYLCSAALEIELSHPSARMSALTLYLAPLVMLALTLGFKRPVMSMVAFPISLLPCFVALEPLDLRPLNDIGGGLTLTSGLVAFLIATARLIPTPNNPSPLLRGKPLSEGISRDFWALLRYMLPRIALMIAFYVVPLVALYSDLGQTQLRANFPKKDLDATFLIHTVHLFIATIATYVALLSPTINRPLDVFELRESLKRARRDARRGRHWWRLSLRTLLVLGVLISLRWWM